MSMVSVKVESLMRKAESARVMELSETFMKWDQSHSLAYNLTNYGTYFFFGLVLVQICVYRMMFL